MQNHRYSLTCITSVRAGDKKVIIIENSGEIPPKFKFPITSKYSRSHDRPAVLLFQCVPWDPDHFHVRAHLYSAVRTHACVDGLDWTRAVVGPSAVQNVAAWNCRQTVSGAWTCGGRMREKMVVYATRRSSSNTGQVWNDAPLVGYPSPACTVAAPLPATSINTAISCSG